MHNSWDYSTKPETDGVVVDYEAFGNQGTAEPPFDLGRTCTHEIGHWLGLIHIWGDDNGSCEGSDNVDDTPNQADHYGGLCPTEVKASCNSHDMYMNYMDYTNDACMNLFTVGQKNVMRNNFNSGEYRENFDIFNPYLSGPNPACASNATYSLNNLPSDATVTWSATPSHLFTNTSGTGSSFSTAWDGSGSGMGTITATLSGDCGSVDVIRNLWVGKPENYFDVSFNPSPVEEFASTTGTASSEGADSYIWDVINGTFLSGQGKSGVQIAAPSCDKNIWVKVTASNSCGESYAISSLEVTCRNKTRSLNIYPVPADDQMRVTIEGPTDDKPYIQTSQQSLHKYYLYNDRYMLVKQGNAPGNTFQVSTNHLPEGFYFLKVVTSKDTYTRKLEIRH